MAWMTSLRSSVGWTRVCGREANDTTPTRMPSGSWATKERAAALAASRRVGSTSVAFIEPDTSMASITVASSRGTATTIDGRARPRTRKATAVRYSTGGRWRRHEGRFGAMLASRSRFVNRTA